jgi:hypothetical protein
MATNGNAPKLKDSNHLGQHQSTKVSDVELTKAAEFINRVGKQLQQLLAESQR